MMKNIVLCGGLLLALYAVAKLLGRDCSVLVSTRKGLQPRVPPCTYTYKNVVFHLN
jgi:hypothetical protein